MYAQVRPHQKLLTEKFGKLLTENRSAGIVVDVSKRQSKIKEMTEDMSQETLTWLNQNTLIGFTDKRGEAWHYRASEQGEEPNHYPGAIPVADVKRRLFGWAPVEGTVTTTVEIGGKTITMEVPSHKSYIHPETGELLGIVGKGQALHTYGKWLVDNTAMILDDGEMGIGSAGLLKGGARAWVQIELDETVDGPGGIQHRPFFTAATVLDGSMSTTYQRGTQLVVCDNTLAMALNESGAARILVPHKSGSEARIQEIREKVGLLYQQGQDFNAEMDKLLTTPVSDREWEQFVAAYLENDRPTEKGRGLTNWDNAHDALTKLYRTDERCSAWTGTAWGALQAANTYEHHVRTVKNVEGGHAERNQLNVISGRRTYEDTRTLDKLNGVLATTAA